METCSHSNHGGGDLVTKLYPTLFHPMDGSPPGSSVYGISLARLLERVVFPSPEDLPKPGIEPKAIVVFWKCSLL